MPLSKLACNLVKLVTAAALLSGCVYLDPYGNDAWLEAPDDLHKAYAMALRDAAEVSPRKVVRDLIAITPFEPGLQWQAGPGKPRVLVMTWTRSPEHIANIGVDMDIAGDTWVTTVPELKKFCRDPALPAGKLALRLEQLLGLPPGAGKKYFVEMWVDPDDLFRPAPNPEITTHESPLEYPRSARFLNVSRAYFWWFEKEQLMTQIGFKRYPWTRLGYTYDWGNPANPRGLSEFVIKKPARVGVASVSEIDVYCER